MQTLRYVSHSPLHLDIEKLLTDEEGNQVWAVIKCFNKENEMSFTFSNNQEVDYPALGMCDTCGKRFTQGCEHSNTLEAQRWLAAHLAAEQGSGISVTEEQADSVHNMIVTAESTEGNFTDGFSDPRTEAEKSADAEWQDEQATRADLRTGFQQW